jgi:hypothetical protein
MRFHFFTCCAGIHYFPRIYLFCLVLHSFTFIYSVLPFLLYHSLKLFFPFLISLIFSRPLPWFVPTLAGGRGTYIACTPSDLPSFIHWSSQPSVLSGLLLYLTYFFTCGLFTALMMVAVSTSVSYVNFYETTCCNIPEDSHLF